MNRADLIRGIAADYGVSQSDAGRWFEAVIDGIEHAVATGQKVTIAGHGTYKPAQRSARTARNPKTGEQIHVPDRVVPVFTAGSEFKGRVARGHLH